MTEVDLRLYAVADVGSLGPDRLVAAVRAAAAGGATLVQLRDKREDSRARVDLARAVKAALPPTVPLLVNDRVDIALASAADGVHLGRLDLRPEDARALLGERAIVGITVHHPQEAEARARIDYAALGPVYATATKDPKDPPLGPDGLERLAAATRERLGNLPLCAIAGIDAHRAGEVIGAGIDGVAVVSALFAKTDVEAAARDLRRVVDAALARRSRP